jgi:dynactin complex subunit
LRKIISQPNIKASWYLDMMFWCIDLKKSVANFNFLGQDVDLPFQWLKQIVLPN